MADVDMNVTALRDAIVGLQGRSRVLVLGEELNTLLDAYEEAKHSRGILNRICEELAPGEELDQVDLMERLARLRCIEQAAQEAEHEYQAGWSEDLDRRMAALHTALKGVDRACWDGRGARRAEPEPRPWVLTRASSGGARSEMPR